MQRQGAETSDGFPFGLVDVCASHPIGIGLVDWSPTRATLIVKIALDQDASGRLSLSPAAPPVTIDTFDDEGNLVFSSDFAPYKPACDVFVVEGPEARTAAGRFTLGSLDVAVVRGETLGPRESTVDAGDPTASQGAWTQPSFDFSRFQASAPTRRVAWPRTGFDVHVERGDVRFHARFVEPFPAVVVAPATGARAIARPTVVLDTIAVDPAASRLVLCFRGILEDTGGAFRGAKLRVELFDAGGNALSPSSLRSIAPTRPADAARRIETLLDDTTTSQGGLDFEQTASAPMARPALRTLPFAGAERLAFADESASTGRSLADLRAEIAGSAAPAEDALEGTVAMQRSPAAIVAPPPHVVAVAATTAPYASPAPPWRPPLVARHDEPAEPEAPTPPLPIRMVGPAAARAPVQGGASAPDPVAPVAPAKLSKLSTEEAAMLQEIQREVWKGERPLVEILGSYGLSDAEWRALKRAARRS